jgi:hypothetical protein
MQNRQERNANSPADIEPLAAARRKRFRQLRDDLVAVRTPLIASGAYCLILLIPDQSADSVRTMFEESVGWLLAILVAWYFTLNYLQVALMAAAQKGFDRADRVQHSAGNQRTTANGTKLSRQRRALLCIIALNVPCVTIFSILSSHAPTLKGLLDVPLSVYIFSFFCVLLGLDAPIWVYLYREQNSAQIIVTGIVGVCLLGFAHSLAIRDLPPLMLITIWIIAVLACLEIIELLSMRYGWPFIVIAAVCIVIFSALDWNDNHEIRKLAIDASLPPPQDIRSVFAEWLSSRKDERSKYDRAQKPYPVFLFAAEGGGLRAAAMTALVLEKLRTSCPDALRHTFLTIGVSGGSVGAMLTNAAIKRDGLGTGCDGTLDDKFGPVTATTKTASDDLLRPLLIGMLFADLPGQFTPFSRISSGFSQATDRARYLEAGISSASQRYTHNSSWTDLLWSRLSTTDRGLDEIPFRSIWGGPAGEIPALMLLATDVSSGRRVAASHVLMPPLPIDKTSPCRLLDASNANSSIPERTRVLSLAELLPENDVSASTGAVLSARFPGVTPAASVRCSNTKLRLVDGGYFENSGLTTAIDVTRAIFRTALDKNVSIYVVSIENSDASPDWRFAQGLPVASPASYFSELMSPFRAIEGSRQAHADIAHASLKELFETARSGDCSKRNCLDQIRFRLRRCKTPIPLGWSLSEAAVKEIRRQLFDPGSVSSSDCVARERDDKSPLESFQLMFSLAKLSQ